MHAIVIDGMTNPDMCIIVRLNGMLNIVVHVMIRIILNIMLNAMFYVMFCFVGNIVLMSIFEDCCKRLSNQKQAECIEKPHKKYPK